MPLVGQEEETFKPSPGCIWLGLESVFQSNKWIFPMTCSLWQCSSPRLLSPPPNLHFGLLWVVVVGFFFLLLLLLDSFWFIYFHDQSRTFRGRRQEKKMAANGQGISKPGMPFPKAWKITRETAPEGSVSSQELQKCPSQEEINSLAPKLLQRKAGKGHLYFRA